MDKKVLIIVGVVVLLLAGAGGYLLTRPKDDGSEPIVSFGSTDKDSDDGIVAETATTIRSLFGGGNNQVCTYSDGEESGTVYTSGDKRVRIDFTSTDPEQGNGSMIMNTEKNYFWDNATKEGYSYAHIDFEEDDGNESSGSDAIANPDLDDSEDVNVDEEYDFSCKKWTVDASVFTPPADVKFTDMSEFMPQQ